MTAASNRPAVTALRAALTARGWVILAGSGLVLGAGIWLGYPELVAVAAAGFAGVLLAFAAVIRTPSLEVARSVAPLRVKRGDGATATVTVRNRSRWRLPALAASDLAGAHAEPFPIPVLAGGAEHPGVVALPTQRRGVITSGPLLVERADPFGLTRRRLDTGSTAALLVRPRAITVPQISVSLARSVDGPQSETTLQGTLAFHALREYVPGDERRHVHWRASAHAGQLMVKQHVDTAHAALAVVFDDIRVPLPTQAGELAEQAERELAEAFEVAVDCAASVAVTACALNQPTALLDGRGRSLLAAESGRRSVPSADDVLDALTPITPSAGPKPDPQDETAAALRALASRGRGSLAVLVSTRDTGAWAGALQSLAGSYARVAAIEVAPPSRPASALRKVGRVSWLGVRSAEELPAALARAWAA